MNQLEKLELWDWPDESKCKAYLYSGCTIHAPSRIIWEIKYLCYIKKKNKMWGGRKVGSSLVT